MEARNYATNAGSPNAPRTISLGCRGNGAVSNLRLWRDIYYTDPGPGHARSALTGPYEITAGECFVLGDNSPISDDSRTFPKPGVSLDQIVGKPIRLP
jgi:signal peptidase I